VVNHKFRWFFWAENQKISCKHPFNFEKTSEIRQFLKSVHQGIILTIIFYVYTSPWIENRIQHQIFPGRENGEVAGPGTGGGDGERAGGGGAGGGGDLGQCQNNLYFTTVRLREDSSRRMPSLETVEDRGR
jgi:hypothetical protein